MHSLNKSISILKALAPSLSVFMPCCGDCVYVWVPVHMTTCALNTIWMRSVGVLRSMVGELAMWAVSLSLVSRKWIIYCVLLCLCADDIYSCNIDLCCDTFSGKLKSGRDAKSTKRKWTLLSLSLSLLNQFLSRRWVCEQQNGIRFWRCAMMICFESFFLFWMNRKSFDCYLLSLVARFV